MYLNVQSIAAIWTTVVSSEVFLFIQENIHKGTVQIRTEKLSEKIKIQKGVRQGDTLSPIMFTDVVEEIFKQIKPITGIKALSSLRFADDTILFANIEDTLQQLLEKLNAKGKKN